MARSRRHTDGAAASPKATEAAAQPAKAPDAAALAAAYGRLARLTSGRSASPPANPYAFMPTRPPGVPQAVQTIAQDAALRSTTEWARQEFDRLALDSQFAPALGIGAYGQAWANGYGFLGYAYLAQLAQVPEYRILTEILADEMTREWIELKSSAHSDRRKLPAEQADRLKKLEDWIAEKEVKDSFHKVAVNDGFLGRGHLYLDTGDGEQREELLTPIGNGRNRASRGKINQDHPLVAVRPVEATWCYPTKYNADDPLKEDWYRPQTWFVMGKEIHVTRLLPFVGRPVPDLLKPVFNFGGLSLSQMAKPYVDNWLRTRQSVADLIWSFSINVLATDLSTLLQSPTGDASVLNRVLAFNAIRNNNGTMVINKDTEEWSNVSTPIAGLHELQAQSQEHMSSVARIPLVKLLGIQPSGLNACLVGGTLIETDRGQIPIRDVRKTDKVLTREGFASLRWSGVTGYATELIEITANNATLLATPWHPIYLPQINAFVPAENVRPGNLLLCRGATGNPNTENRSRTVIDSGGTGKMVITPRRRLMTESHCFTEKFGECITALSQRAITFITSTKIARTIRSGTFNFCRQKITQGCTTLRSSLFEPRLTSSGSAAIAGNLSSYCNILGSCFAATGADVQIAGKTGNPKPSRALSAFALFAASRLRQNERTPNTAPKNVRPLARIEPTIAAPITGSTPKNGRYLRNSGEFGIPCAVSSVRRVSANESVYDIQVSAGYLPEFFANGICVHNSSEGEVRTFYDTIHARQEFLFRPHLTTVLNFAQLSLFGDIDEEITFDFVPLWQLDEAGKSAVQQQKSATRETDIASGVITPQEGRMAAAADPDSQYASLDLDDEPDAASSEEETEALMRGEVPKPKGEEDDPDANVEKRLGGPKPKAGSRLSTEIVNRSAEFGGPSTGGFSGGRA